MWTFQDLNKPIAPTGFQSKKLDNCVLYSKLVFDDKTKFAETLESNNVDDNLHVQLQYNGMPLPLPQWFFQCHTSPQVGRLLLEKFSMLSLLLLNKIQQGGADAMKALKTVQKKAPFLVTVFSW